MQLNIRPMQENDAPAVNKLSVQLGYGLSVAETEKQISSILRNDEHLALVATNNKDVIGWIHAFRALHIESLPFVEIGGLVVDESCRGTGVGKALVHHIKQWCVDQQVYSLRVRSQVKRLDAHQFYRHLQFHEIKEQKVFELSLNV
jgi:predicted N-acetyltransferase YhbS